MAHVPNPPRTSTPSWAGRGVGRRLQRHRGGAHIAINAGPQRRPDRAQGQPPRVLTLTLLHRGDPGRDANFTTLAGPWRIADVVNLARSGMTPAHYPIVLGGTATWTPTSSWWWSVRATGEPAERRVAVERDAAGESWVSGPSWRVRQAENPDVRADPRPVGAGDVADAAPQARWSWAGGRGSAAKLQGDAPAAADPDAWRGAAGGAFVLCGTPEAPWPIRPILDVRISDLGREVSTLGPGAPRVPGGCCPPGRRIVRRQRCRP